MINFIINNLSTFIVSFILICIVIKVIKIQIKTKRSCGCGGCSSCPMANKCHNEK